MKIVADKNIKKVFIQLILLTIFFIITSFVIIKLCPLCAGACVIMVGICTAVIAFFVIYKYFKKQHEIMEQAVMQIRAFMSGNQDARIECNDEGEFNRLFHEVNSLVTVLNAKYDNESRSKLFLKDTISNISHQLKTPLAALGIYNGIIQSETDNSSEIKKFANLSEEELERIDILIQNLLKIAKLDAGTLILEISDENLSEMMKDIEKHFIFRAQNEGKHFELFGSDDISFSCDKNWLEEAISNLIKNAFDHTREGNAITLSWHSYASIVQIIVEDNGCGIHPEDMPFIFQRFYRSKFPEATQGTGLGLPLAKSIIEAHGGTIEVSSIPQKGTKFTINLLIPTKL